jgi:hypothetical protein
MVVRHVFDNVFNDLCEVVKNIVVRAVWIILHIRLGVYTGLSYAR